MFRIKCISQSSCRLRFVAQKPKSFFTIPENYQDLIIHHDEVKDVAVDFYSNQQGRHKDTLLIYCELSSPACDIADEVLREISTIYKV